MAQDIAQWLEELGLGQQARAFAENGVDLEDPPHLRDQDFERLGMLLGRTRRLQAAIEGPAAANPPTRSVVSPAREPECQPAEAERRQVTVPFRDLVGATTPTAGLDREDLRDLPRACQGACSGMISRYDGDVAKFMGDGVY